MSEVTSKNDTSRNDTSTDVTTECIKVAELRKKYGPDIDLKKWMAQPNNLYCGRAGRIFIYHGKEKERFAYPASIWANPYRV